MKIKEVKSNIDLFCASPASTAICSSTVDPRAIVRHSTTKPNNDHRRHRTTSLNTTKSTRCLSQLPIDPSKSFLNHRKSTSDYANNKRRTCDQKSLLRRKSSADVDDLSGSRHLLSDHEQPHYYLDFVYDPKRDNLQVSRQPAMKEKSYNNSYYKCIDSSSDHGFVKSLKSSSTKSYESPPVHETPRVRTCGDDDAIRHQNEKSLASLSDHLNVEKTSTSSLAAPDSNHKVVELRVSIHCKGCEGKLRKHISRMQGVTSFSIDLATKKVRVIGNVRPLEVLTSISKVKNAQFWPSPASSSLIKIN